MKTTPILLAILLVPLFSFGQWSKVINPATSTLFSIDFLDASKGFAAGSEGVLLMTADSGQSWSTLQSGTNMQLNTICFIDDTVGFIAAAGPDGGKILRTSDGGTQWEAVLNNSANWITDLHFVDNQTGYATSGCYSSGGYLECLYKTVDRGLTWQTILSPVNSDMEACFFLDSNTGFAVGEHMRVIKTTDGGANWEIIEPLDNKFNLNDVFFTTPSTGYVCGAVGTLLKTTDAGASWTTLPSGTVKDLFSICFTSESNGYIVGSSGLILMTNDAGSSWVISESGITESLFSLDFIDEMTGFACGESGTILRTTNAGELSIEKYRESTPNFSLYPNPATDRITILPNQPVYEQCVVSISNIKGLKVFEQEFTYREPMDLNLESLVPGLYLVRIRLGSDVENLKLLIQE